MEDTTKVFQKGKVQTSVARLGHGLQAWLGLSLAVSEDRKGSSLGHRTAKGVAIQCPEEDTNLS